MTGITVDLHHRSPVLYQVKIAHLFAHQRFFPMLDKPMRRFRVGSKALSAVTDRTAILIEWMRLQDFLRVRLKRLGHVIQSLPLHALMTRDAAIGSVEILNPDLLKSLRDLLNFIGAKLPGH